MNLSRLLFIHAVVTLVAGVVLIMAPEVIPATAGIVINKSAYLLCYLLGAAELALAYLSFSCSRLKNNAILRLASATFVVYHMMTALVEIIAYMQGVPAVIWINVGLRILISFLFVFYGLIKLPR